MKKFLTVILACSMVLSLAGCASGDTSAKSDYETNISTGTITDITNDIDPSSSTADKPSDSTGLSASTTVAPARTEIEKTDDFSDFADDYDYGISFDAAGSIEGGFAPAGGAMDDSTWLEGGFADEYYDEPEYSDDYFDEYIEIEPLLPDEPYIEQTGPGQLTAGEWNDNEHWNDWISLYQSHEDWEYYRDEWNIDFDVRHEVIVTAFGEPLEGATVTQRSCGNIGVTSAVTDNEGKAYLFLEECNDDTEHYIEVTYGEVRMIIEDVDATSSGTYTADFENASLSPVEVRDYEALELMLMIDTTGSMSDELWYIQTELENVIERVKDDNANIPIRVSVNFYRDEYDDYIIREFDFTDDIEQVLSDLAEQEAAGGGDTPEAVHTALNSAINEHDWKDNATKLMFIVLDAPPHSDEQIIDEVNSCIEIAAAQGIRIIPVASSGIDKSTEYLLRTMAFRTGGTYTFLTDHSGIGGSHIEPTIGDYEVEKLNDLMVRVISEYLE